MKQNVVEEKKHLKKNSFLTKTQQRKGTKDKRYKTKKKKDEMTMRKR